MTTVNEKIKVAAAKLDPTNDAHWTPDGLPKLGMVQKVAGDQTIKLKDIEASGVVRPNAAPQSDADFEAGDPVEHTGADAGGPKASAPAPRPQAAPVPQASNETGVGPQAAPAPQASNETGVGPQTAAADPSQAQPGEGEQGEYVTEEEYYAILKGNVEAAEQAVEDARQKQAEGRTEELNANKAFLQAKQDFVSAFPPKTAAENIREYINSENQKRAERAGLGAPASRVDAAMGRGNSRGWRRPVRGVIGADGSLIKNADGTVAMPRQMQVRPNRIIPSMGTRTAGPVQRQA